jgi:hypothetical protein
LCSGMLSLVVVCRGVPLRLPVADGMLSLVVGTVSHTGSLLLRHPRA